MVTKDKTKTSEKVNVEPSEETIQVETVAEVIPDPDVSLAVDEPDATPEPEVVEEPETEKLKPKRKTKPKPDDVVTVKVIHGSVSAVWFHGEHNKGEVFKATRQQAESIDPRFVVVLE